MGADGNAAMTKRKKALARAGLSVLLAALLAAGLSYRRGLTLYQLEPSPLGLWHRPAPKPPEAAHSFTLTFTGSASRLSLMFSGETWYYQNSEMEGFLPCSVQPDGAQAGEEIGKLLWEMIPTWEAYGYH